MLHQAARLERDLGPDGAAVGALAVAAECGGLAWFLPEDRGYTCEYGHDHIYAEVRHHEGWDYAADPEEVGLLAGRGIQPVAMNGGGIEIDAQAMRYAASLPG